MSSAGTSTVPPWLRSISFCAKQSRTRLVRSSWLPPIISPPKPSALGCNAARRAAMGGPTESLSLVSSTAGHTLRVFDVGPRIADKHVPVRHLDRAQRLGIERGLRRQQSVQIEDVSRNRIDIVIAQRLRRVLRHGAADIIEQRRRVGPIAADGPHRIWRRERALAADKLIANTTLALCAMTGRALLIEDLAAMADATASRRKVVAVAVNIDIPAPDLRRRG